MRPKSIIMFERLFLASLALSLISFALAYDKVLDELANDPAMAELGFGGGLITGVATVGYAIYLLLWFLIARKASNVAKWILIVFLALSAISIPGLFMAPIDRTMVASLAVYGLEIAAAVYLFQDDAKAWFRREWHTDASTFD